MKIRFYILLLSPLVLAHCASTSNPPGPEGTGDHKSGYNLGRSDAVKQQYWILVNQQKEKTEQNQENVRYYEIPVPEQTIDGTILNPTTKLLRIEE